jgi:hypothetical protein
MLSVFGDESADETKQRVFAVGGVIGSEEAWLQLERKWIARTGGIPFHANDCDSDQGDFKGNDHEENKNLYRDLAIMISESELGGWGFAIDLAAQRQVFPEAPELSYYKCFLEVLQAMRNCAVTNNQLARFTFDMRRKSEYNTSILYDMATKIPSWRDQIFSSIAFVSSRDNPRLQVADLFTREVMKALDNQIGPAKRPPRKSWMALFKTGRFHAEAIGLGWFESLKSQMPLLEANTGMSGDKYLLWLEKSKRQHNTTNLFLYMEHLGKE